MNTMRKDRTENINGEVTVTIDMNLIRKGLGTHNEDSGRVYYTNSDLVEIGCRVDTKFKGTTAHNTTAELIEWCPAPVWITVVWHCSLFATRLFRQNGTKMIEVL